MNDLEQYFQKSDHRLITKWDHYFEIYDRHFSRFRNKEVVIVEIGVFQGGSLQLWKNYFGPRAKIYGIDINPECKKLEEENITVLIGSQSDRSFLNTVKKEIPPIDILIDDGGHSMRQQIISFQELFDHIKPEGVYLCEDLHTSYWIEFGGGYKRSGTFIEFSKNLIDQLNAFNSRQRSLSVNEFTTTANSLHFYDSMLVIEKRNRTQPKEVFSGKRTIEKTNLKSARSIKYYGLLYINLVLRFFNLSSLRW